jgi:hypothetical protein
MVSKMEIDRRDLLTGMAGTGASLCQGFGGQAAAMLPALPPFAVEAARRFYFPERLFFSLATPWSEAVATAHHDSRWHFDPNLGGAALLRHEASGLTFRRAWHYDYPFGAEAIFIDAPLDGWPDAKRMLAVGRAAVSNFVVGHNLRYWNRLYLPFYFRYKRGKGYSIPSYVEDAPALI